MKKLIISMIMLSLICMPLTAEEMTSKAKVNFYGFIKTDIMYSEHGTAGNELAIFTASENANDNQDKDLRITARDSRFGFNIKDGKVSAKIELDFWGDDGSDGAGTQTVDPRLRHAYINMQFDKYDLLVGQTWHLTPLEFSSTASAIAMGGSGALWYRVPQIRFTFKKKKDTQFAVALTRATRVLIDGDGTASGVPMIQANMVKTSKAGKKLTLSVAHGKHTNAANLDAKIQLVALGFKLPSKTKKVTLNGQVWSGQNLSDFLGGIFNAAGYGDDNEIKAVGGFINFKIKKNDKCYLNLGYGMDNPDEDKLAVGNRIKNTTYFLNIQKTLLEKVTKTIEVGNITTDYKVAAGTADDSRSSMYYRLSYKYSF